VCVCVCVHECAFLCVCVRMGACEPVCVCLRVFEHAYVQVCAGEFVCGCGCESVLAYLSLCKFISV
jgi:hypothetical protein